MFNLPTKTIKVTENESFSVHGLSISDVVSLYWSNPDKLSSVFADVMQDYLAGKTLDVLHKVMIVLPDCVADTIALASGVEMSDNKFKETSLSFRRLPIAVQADALDAILELTFASDMPPKKMLGLLLDTVKEMIPEK